MKNKNLILTAVTLLASGLLAGCGGDGDGRDHDYSKTQLYVAAIRSGVEDGWLQDLAERFMAKYSDYSFEPGKTGIQVWVDGDKTAYSGTNVATNIESDNHQIYCIEGAKYNEFISPKEKVLNLKDILNIKGSDGNTFYKDEKSILERMDPSFKQSFVKQDGNIYMIPYYESFCSFQYDRDVFNDVANSEGKSFYFKRSDLVIADDASMADYYADVENGDYAPLYDEFMDDVNENEFDFDALFCDKDEDPSHRSIGPDGIAGTFDDGLPQTFTEFATLLFYMKSFGYTPILGNKTYNYYFADMLASVWANEEGIDNMNLNFNWNGVANDLLKIDSATNKIVRNGDELVYDNPTSINAGNAVELHRQEGVYRALEFSKLIVDNNPKTDAAWTKSQSYLVGTKFAAKDEFRFGLLCDGNWWENETKSTFSSTRTDPKNRLNRNFSFFTMPKSSSKKWDSTRGDMTFYNINQSTMFLNKKLETTDSNLMEAAKAFFLYINSNEGMSAFTASTSISRPFEYTLTSSDVNNTSPYGKDMMKLRSYLSDKDGETAGYNICTAYPLSNTVAANEGKVHKYEWNFQLRAGYAQDKANPVGIMQLTGISPEDYFVESYQFMTK